MPPRSFGDVSAVRWQDIDLLDRTRVAQAIAELCPTEIYHCAGIANVRTSWDNTTLPLEGNVRETQFLLQAVGGAGLASRVLIPGSALVYKPSTRAIGEDHPIGPVSPYGLSKLAQEMLGQRFADEGLNVLLARSFTHLGPGQDPTYAASSFAHQIARIEASRTEPVIHVGSLDARRDLTDVRDTVVAYQGLMARGVPRRAYNVCSGQAYRIGDVLDELLRQARVTVRVQVDSSRLRPQDNALLIGDPSRIHREVGWLHRIPLRDTLCDLLNYWREVVGS